MNQSGSDIADNKTQNVESESAEHEQSDSPDEVSEEPKEGAPQSSTTSDQHGTVLGTTQQLSNLLQALFLTNVPLHREKPRQLPLVAQRRQMPNVRRRTLLLPHPVQTQIGMRHIMIG